MLDYSKYIVLNSGTCMYTLNPFQFMASSVGLTIFAKLRKLLQFIGRKQYLVNKHMRS